MFYYKSFIGFLFNLTISIIVVYIGHFCWNYIKDMYSTKKTKDLVNIHVEKYKKIIKEIEENNVKTKDSFLNEKERNKMDKELQNFMTNLEEPFECEKDFVKTI
jgi:hypothetical protein